MKFITLIILSAFCLFGYSQTWFEVTSGTDKKLNTLDFPSNEVGYIDGNYSLILKSTDGGRN